MRMENLGSYSSNIAGFDFERSWQTRRSAADPKIDDALQKVEDARESNTQATLQMIDRHNEMVKKSQEVFLAKQKKRAIERLNTERREEHSDFLAKMAISNAERRDLLETSRLRDQMQTQYY